MSAITTHVLDLARGCPAADVAVSLEFEAEGETGRTWQSIGWGRTDPDGRLKALLPEGQPVAPGTYRLIFHTREYFEASATTAFYPTVSITFTAGRDRSHYHVPLLLGPYGYTTYLGT